MSSTQERIKKRREYLMKKGWAFTGIGMNALLFVVLTLTSLLLLFLMIYFHLYSFSYIFLTIIGVLSFGFISWSCVRSILADHKTAKQLPYVPPVTVDTLPAEEVLVRGVEEPAQEQRKVLLRGTESSAGTGEQALLRSSQAQGEE